MRITEKAYTPEMNKLISKVVGSGPSEDELIMLSVLAMFDETMQALAHADQELAGVVLELYQEIELYLRSQGVEN